MSIIIKGVEVMAFSGVNDSSTIHKLFSDLNSGSRDSSADNSNFLTDYASKIDGQAQNEAVKDSTYATRQEAGDGQFF